MPRLRATELTTALIFVNLVDGKLLLELVILEAVVFFASEVDPLSFKLVCELEPKLLISNSNSVFTPLLVLPSKLEMNFLHINWVQRKLTFVFDFFVLCHHHLFLSAS
jgi:hypothetical protein